MRKVRFFFNCASNNIFSESAETCDGTGREIPIADYKRAYIIQDYTNKFYSCMKERLDQLAIAARREDLLVVCFA